MIRPEREEEFLEMCRVWGLDRGPSWIAAVKAIQPPENTEALQDPLITKEQISDEVRRMFQASIVEGEAFAAQLHGVVKDPQAHPWLIAWARVTLYYVETSTEKSKKLVEEFRVVLGE